MHSELTRLMLVSLRSILAVVFQVPPRQLPEYLRRMRADGYTLVGLEQTSNSQPANQYQFPAKTLLLLG